MSSLRSLVEQIKNPKCPNLGVFIKFNDTIYLCLQFSMSLFKFQITLGYFLPQFRMITYNYAEVILCRRLRMPKLKLILKSAETAITN